MFLKNKVKEFTLSHIKIVRCWHEDKQINQGDRINSPKTDSHMYGLLILDRSRNAESLRNDQ